MAKTYTTTIKIDCVKEHTCVSCGAVYSYPFFRKIKGQGRNAAKSQTRAQANVQKALANEVDLHPCPACGIYQPDMIGQKRRRWHLTTFWVALAAFVTLVILRLTYVLPANTLTWIMAAVAVLTALQLVGKEIKNFNRDPQANLQIAQDEIAAGKLTQTAGEPAEVSADWAELPRSLVQKLATPLLALGIILIASAELVRMAGGWPLNADAYPPVVGPDDVPRIYMNQRIHSVNGFWRAVPTVTLSTLDSAETVQLHATTNENTWSGTIQVQSGDSASASTPWVEVQMPQDAKWAGKTVNCDISMVIAFPQMEGDSTYTTAGTTMDRSVSLRLAGAGAGLRYDTFWWGGGSAGMAIILVVCLGLSRSARTLQKKAKPTKIITPAAPQTGA